MRNPALLPLLAALLPLACTQAPAEPGGALPCDVDAVLAASCRSCHGTTPKYGAPMPLVTYADLLAPAVSDPSRKVYELVDVRTHDRGVPMPPAPATRLDDADQAALDHWIDAGAAPADSAVCGGGGGGAGGSGGGPSCEGRIPVAPTSKYRVPKDVDDIYVCSGVDVTVDPKRHVTAFLPHVDNAQVVHHIVLFQSDTPVSPEPTPCGISGATDWRMVDVWLPGNDGFVLPEEAGFPLEGTTHYVVQIHYNNLTHLAGEEDASGMDLCTTEKLRPNDADVAAFGTTRFTIPAHGSLDIDCDFQVPAGAPTLHVIGAEPHMHKLGTLMSTVVEPRGTDLGTRDPWDWNAQTSIPLDVTVSPGDVIRTRCAWNNPGARAVTWGEGTADEMCWSFTTYYPRIEAPNWNWALPSELATCKPHP